MKPYFNTGNNDHFSALQREVHEILKGADQRNCNRSILSKGLLLIALFISGIVGLWSSTGHQFLYLMFAAFLGMLCLPIVLNIGHEAVHGNFTNHRLINRIAKNVFYFLGTSTHFWEMRHIHSHHVFPNIIQWDLDMNQTGLIRLSQQQKLSFFHRYQHLYMPLLFPLYTINWFFFRDIKDLMRSEFGSRKNIKHGYGKVTILILGKLWHLFFLVLVPFMVSHNVMLVVCGFFVFHLTASIFTTFALISTHVGAPQVVLDGGDGKPITWTWFEHQVLTTANFSTGSKFALHFFGGFNHHLTHHLFPHIPYHLYPSITPVVKRHLLEANLPYYEYDTLIDCMVSHFKRLRSHSVSQEFDFQL